MGIKECTRCSKKHELETKYCQDCKDYMNNVANPKWNSQRNARMATKYVAPNESVYAFLEDEEVVYIGSSGETPFRIYKHYNDRHVSFAKDMSPLMRQSKFTWKILYQGSDYSHVEKILIRNMDPKYNKIKYKNYHG